MAYRMKMFKSQKPSSVDLRDLRVSDFKRVPGFNYVSAEDEHTDNSLCALTSERRRPSTRQTACKSLWGGAGALEGTHAGGRWGPTARRRRRFFRIFSAIFYLFHGNSAYLRPCYHALRQPVGAADRALLHN